jgi:iron complex outermembrane receptor protein
MDIYKSYILEGERQVTPRASLVYQPQEGSVIKMLYGQAFRIPNSYELLFCGPSYIFVCNPTLRPETNNSYEIVYDQVLRPNLNGNVSLFQYDIEDLISSIDRGNGKLQFQNINQVQGTGVETGLKSRWASGATSYVHYTYQVVKDQTTEEIFFNSPRHLAGAGGTVPVFDRNGSLGIEGQSVGSRKTVVPGESVDAYFVTNLTLTRRNLYKKMDVSCSIYNLFDTQYTDPGFEAHKPVLRIPQNGRNFGVKVMGRF